MPSLPTIKPEDVTTAARASHGGAFDAPATGAGAFDAPATGARSEALTDYVMRLGDDSLVLGQRLGEWCGHAPALEIDLSLANFALDLIGQATLFLGLAGDLEGQGRDADALAFHRDVLDFRNCLMVEQPNGDFARTMARQLLFSTFQAAAARRLGIVGRSAPRRDRRQGGQGSALSCRTGQRLGRPPRRRHRRKPSADDRRARLALAFRRRTVRDGRGRR